MCHGETDPTATDRLNGYTADSPTEMDIRIAIDLRAALETRVDTVLRAVLKARGRSNNWRVTSWEVVTKRDGPEEMQITTSYWFQGDTHASSEVVAFPFRYLWHADPGHEEKGEQTVRLLAKQAAERKQADHAVAAAQVAAALKLEREMTTPTCVGCGKQPATGEVFNGRGGVAPACEPCGTATAAANATARYVAWNADHARAEANV